MNIKSKIAIVQAYIHIRKGVEVDIRINNITDFLKLNQAHTIAKEWFKRNNVKINML